MLFNSWVFVALMLVVLPLYYGVLSSWRHAASGQMQLLILASLVFYGYHLPWLLLLFGTSLLVNGRAAEILLQPGHSPRRRWAVLMSALGVNLGALAFFKYATLLARTILPEALFRPLAPWLANIPLPVGISFYTFQGLALVVDAYRGRTEGLESLQADLNSSRWRFHAKVWMFIAFFPQLVAGPILRAHDFVNQIGRKVLANVDWEDALRKLITGYFLKMVVADNLKDVTAALTFPHFEQLSKMSLLALLYGFSFQIFADFAGYSLIAMGLARLFGYRLIVNFNFPYLAQSVTEFWRRWHISLSTFLRDYLYIPLGGNRHGELRTYWNLFVVMFLGGLWHGAAWGFAIWGTAHGVLLAVERFWSTWRGRLRAQRSASLGGLIRTCITFNVVSALWLLFKLSDFQHLRAFVQAFVNNGWGGIPPRFAFLLIFGSVPVVVYHLWGAGLRQVLRQRVGPSQSALLERVVVAFLAFLIIVNAGTPGAFIYFQF